MSGISQAAILAASLDRAEKLADELRILIRSLNDLAQTIEDPALTFHDDEQIVTWNCGNVRFQKTGFALYLALKAIDKAGEDRMTHAELAEVIYDNDAKSVKNLLYRLQSKLENANCPKQLRFDRTFVWLEIV